MSDYPSLPPIPCQRIMTTRFGGLRRGLHQSAGELIRCENLSSRCYPALSSRLPRGRISTDGAVQGLLGKEKPAWVAKGRLYYDGEQTPLAALTEGDKQLVSMGAYILVFPDKRYYNTADPTDYGSLEACYTSTGVVRYSLCTGDGTDYVNQTTAATPPENPTEGALWVDIGGEEAALRQYSAAQGQWVELSGVYTKLTFVSNGELPGLFREYDGVTVSGAAAESGCNGERVIYKLGTDGRGDYIVLAGLLKTPLEQTDGTVKIERRCPDMDYVCQCSNRLWGCRYGEGLNQLYACALGDFKNWRRFMGNADDSWAASCGSDGPFTGAAAFMSSPVFFKADRIHRITVSAGGGHRVTDTVCRGVEPGSSGSIAQVGERLYYKSADCVCAWQGGFPVSVSKALGETMGKNAVAGSLRDSYYLSVEEGEGRSLYVYDTGKDLWLREDGLNCRFFATVGDELYCADDRGLWAMLGSLGEREKFVSWSAESGKISCSYPGKKYMSRFTLRLQSEAEGSMDLLVRYDSRGEFERVGRVKLSPFGSVSLPIRPRRCDHMELRLEGRGDLRLLSMSRMMEQGSEI